MGFPSAFCLGGLPRGFERLSESEPPSDWPKQGVVSVCFVFVVKGSSQGTQLFGASYKETDRPLCSCSCLQQAVSFKPNTAATKAALFGVPKQKESKRVPRLDIVGGPTQVVMWRCEQRSVFTGPLL